MTEHNDSVVVSRELLRRIEGSLELRCGTNAPERTEILPELRTVLEQPAVDQPRGEWQGYTWNPYTTPQAQPMSEIFERILKEKQDEIDRLKEYQASNTEAWAAHHKWYEELAQAAFMVLDSESPECHFHLKRVLIKQGWCQTCECSPCECEGQYD